MPGRRLAGRDDFFCGLIDRSSKHAYWFEAQESSSAAEQRPNKACKKQHGTCLTENKACLNCRSAGREQHDS